MKKKSLIFIGLIAVFVFIMSAVQIWRLCSQSGLRSRASAFMASGDFQQAERLYERLGDSAAASDCAALMREEEYQKALVLFQSGDVQGAAPLFSALEAYKDSKDLLAACAWQDALASGDTNRLLTARRAFARQGDHSYCTEALAQIDPALFENGQELAASFELESALDIFETLGSYNLSDKLAQRIQQMLDWADAPEGEKLLTEDNRYMRDKLDNVYVCDQAYIVVPENCDYNTKFFIYFPGGRNEEMSIDYLLYYMMNPSPKTLAVFMRRNGLEDMEGKTSQAVEILDRAAAECGVFPREIVTAGSSLGAYPAMHSAVYAYEDHALMTDCVLSLDAGSDWMESQLLLSESQCRTAAELGIQFYLFESPWVGMNREGICLMVNTGNKVTMVGCYFDDHVRISLDAMGMGVVDWAVGDRSQPCNPDIYSFVTLHPGDEDKWE